MRRVLCPMWIERHIEWLVARAVGCGSRRKCRSGWNRSPLSRRVHAHARACPPSPLLPHCLKLGGVPERHRESLSHSPALRDKLRPYHGGFERPPDCCQNGGERWSNIPAGRETAPALHRQEGGPGQVGSPNLLQYRCVCRSLRHTRSRRTPVRLRPAAADGEDEKW